MFQLGVRSEAIVGGECEGKVGREHIEWHAVNLIGPGNRYYDQEFAYISKKSLKKLVKMKKCERAAFEAAASAACVSKRRLIVPSPIPRPGQSPHQIDQEGGVG